jgi:hypothetical protein
MADSCFLLSPVCILDLDVEAELPETNSSINIVTEIPTLSLIQSRLCTTT